MKMKVKLEFSSVEADAVREFCRSLSMKADEFCKRAVIYAMNDSHKKARKLQEAEEARQQLNSLKEAQVNGAHDTASRIDSADNAEGLQSGGDVDPDTLANTEAAQDSSTEGTQQL